MKVKKVFPRNSFAMVTCYKFEYTCLVASDYYLIYKIVNLYNRLCSTLDLLCLNFVTAGHSS